MLFLVPAISQTHKSLENSQDFFVKFKTKTKTFTSSPRPSLWVSRPRPRPKTKTLFFVLEAPRDQEFGLEDYITAFARTTDRTRRLPLLIYGRTLSDASMLYFADVFLYFFLTALVGQTAERIFTKLSHVVDISCYLRTF